MQKLKQRDMDYKETMEKIEPKYRPLVEMCIDTISEYKNGSLGDATINELERQLNALILQND